MSGFTEFYFLTWKKNLTFFLVFLLFKLHFRLRQASPFFFLLLILNSSLHKIVYKLEPDVCLKSRDIDLFIDFDTRVDDFKHLFHQRVLKQVPELPCEIEVRVGAEVVILLKTLLLSEEVVGCIKTGWDCFFDWTFVDEAFWDESISDSYKLVERFIVANDLVRFKRPC